MSNHKQTAVIRPDNAEFVLETFQNLNAAIPALNTFSFERNAELYDFMRTHSASCLEVHEGEQGA